MSTSARPTPLRALVTAVAARLLFLRFRRIMPTRANYRRREVSLAAGPALAASALGAVVLDPRIDRRLRLGVAVAAGTAAAVGALDDHCGSASTRGLRGHLAALRRGQVTTGAVKLASIGFAGVVAGWRLVDGRASRRLAAGAVVAASANLVNLLDLRPGRALKAGVLAATPLVVGSGPGRRVAAAAGSAALSLLPADLSEQAMIGDTGANCLGAMLGVAAVTGASTRRIVTCLAVLASLTAASELVSFSRVIDETPALRWFDLLGRSADD